MTTIKLDKDISSIPEILTRTKEIATFKEGDDHLPESGDGTIAALEYFWNTYSASIPSSVGPRYFGYVIGGVTPAALAADWLVSTIDQNTFLTNDSVAASIELATITQFKELIGLPSTFTGTFVSGATMASFVGLATARQFLGAQRGIDVAMDGLAALGPIQVLSTNAHCSAIKALSMLGLGRSSHKQIDSLPEDPEAIDVKALEAYLVAHPNIPTIVIAGSGTINTVSFDDLQSLVKLRETYPFWLHVDAAFGGVAACSPRFSHLVAGWEHADSITIDAHKWLNVPYDSAIQLTRHMECQMQVFQNHSAYLAPPVLRPDNYLHLQPQNSRRFRALPLWMSFKAYGASGIREALQSTYVEYVLHLTMSKAMRLWPETNTLQD
eukprot:gene6717-7810_t